MFIPGEGRFTLSLKPLGWNIGFLRGVRKAACLMILLFKIKPKYCFLLCYLFHGKILFVLKMSINHLRGKFFII
jgi:hypothetical protein